MCGFAHRREGHGVGAVDRDRFPRFVYRHGDEPDPRFSLANERTFLAWTRTSLALAAVGVALDVVTSATGLPMRRSSSVVLVSLSALVATAAWWRWALVERALRRREPLPAPTLILAMAGGLLLVAGVLGVGVIAG